LKANFIPKLANKSFKNLEVKLASLFDIIFFGKPCNLMISLMKIHANSIAEKIVFTGMK